MNLLKQLFVSLMAMLMFTSSTCFAVDVHFCKDEVQSRALFTKAKPCKNMPVKVDKKLPECCKKRQEAKERKLKKGFYFKKKPCCHNKSFIHKSDVNNGAHQVTASTSSDAAALINQAMYIVTEPVASLAINLTFREPPEPDISRDYCALFQVYII